MNNGLQNCVICAQPAIRVYTPMLENLPNDPQGFIKFKLFGVGMPFCNKHRLSYQVVSIKSDNGKST